MKTGNFKEQARSGVYENGKFQRMNKLGPAGYLKTGNFKHQAESKF
jgi:hypothetical protein